MLYEHKKAPHRMERFANLTTLIIPQKEEVGND